MEILQEIMLEQKTEKLLYQIKKHLGTGQSYL